MVAACRHFRRVVFRADGVRDGLCDPRPRRVGRTAAAAGTDRAGGDQAASKARGSRRQDRATCRRWRRGRQGRGRPDEAPGYCAVRPKTVGGCPPCPCPSWGLTAAGRHAEMPEGGSAPEEEPTMLDGYIY